MTSTEVQPETFVQNEPKPQKFSPLFWVLLIGAIFVIVMGLCHKSKKVKPTTAISDENTQIDEPQDQYDLYQEIKSFLDKQASYVVKIE